MLTTPIARTLAVMSITGLIALNIPSTLISAETAGAQAVQTGCIDVLKEVFDPQGNRLPVVPGFNFQTATGQSDTNDSTGFVRLHNVPVGLRTVTETQANGWTQVLVTPSGGQVYVAGGNHCSGIVFKNKQNSQGSSSSSSSNSSSSSTSSSSSSSSTSSNSSSSSAGTGNGNQNADVDSNANTNVNVNINAGSSNVVNIDQDSDGGQSNQDADVDANADTDVDVSINAWSGNNVQIDQDSNGGTADQNADVDTDADTDVDANIDAWSGNEINVDQDSEGDGSSQDADVDSNSNTDVDVEIDANSENNTSISQNADTDSGNANTRTLYTGPLMQTQNATQENVEVAPVSRTQALFNKIMLKLRSSNGNVPQWTIDAAGYAW